jgi:putative ABC transport system permease protein
VIVYSADANKSVIRSRIDPSLRSTIERVDGVTAVGGLGFALVGAKVPGHRTLADAAVIGYERAPSGVPAIPPEGEGWADRRLQAFGVRQGQVLGLGPQRVPIRVRGWVSDTNYLLQGALWVSPTTWRTVQAASRPDASLAAGTWQVLGVQGRGDPARLARSIDRATHGATLTLTKNDAVLASPGTREQKSTFAGIIGVAFVVAGLVIALFFALLTLEQVPVYGVLKAVGTTTRSLFAGLLAQAFVVASIAFVLGGLATLGLAVLLPRQIPLLLEPSRAVGTYVGLVVTAAIGGALSLRRVARIDPVTAIGTGT